MRLHGGCTTEQLKAILAPLGNSVELIINCVPHDEVSEGFDSSSVHLITLTHFSRPMEDALFGIPTTEFLSLYNTPEASVLESEVVLYHSLPTTDDNSRPFEGAV